MAGATPHMRPLHQQTWETFSANWDTDVKITFHWLREALLTLLRPGSKVVVFSSGVALNPYLQQLDYPLVTPQATGTALVELVRADAATVAPAYRLSGAGLQKLP